MRVLVVHGPNLNMLGKRDIKVYGHRPLSEINEAVKRLADKLKVDVDCFQSNSEGAIIDYIQTQGPDCDGIIINGGAFTHYSYAIRDALADMAAPVIEVHLSNIYAREEWRAKSVIAPIARGQICGLGWRGYLVALEAMVNELKGRE